jgi:hypothetical protein
MMRPTVGWQVLGVALLLGSGAAAQGTSSAFKGETWSYGNVAPERV